MVNQYIEHSCGSRSVLARLIVQDRTPRGTAELLTTSGTISPFLQGVDIVNFTDYCTPAVRIVLLNSTMLGSPKLFFGGGGKKK